MPTLDASGALFFFALAGAPVVAAVALLRSYRQGTLVAPDLGIPVLPTVAFLAVAIAREELRTGWALLVWPILIAMLSMYLLAAKLLLLQRFCYLSRNASHVNRNKANRALMRSPALSPALVPSNKLRDPAASTSHNHSACRNASKAFGGQ